MTMVSYERVSEHPVRWALTAASVIFGWVFFLSDSLVVAACVGAAVFAMSWAMWRPNGMGHRLRKWILERFP